MHAATGPGPGGGRTCLVTAGSGSVRVGRAGAVDRPVHG